MPQILNRLHSRKGQWILLGATLFNVAQKSSLITGTLGVLSDRAHSWARRKVVGGSGSKRMAEAMVFKLIMEAEKGWHRIRGHREIENSYPGLFTRMGKG